jgi:cytochrome oxidase Cu insertion factor (SCO1/SenC/PrrC family)/Cu/Ag efflux protein CusF/tetratricopeptide (TPR) repeat protein
LTHGGSQRKIDGGFMKKPWRAAAGVCLVLMAAIAVGGRTRAQGQPASAVTLRMIVVATVEEATRIVERLTQGADFAALAAEQSIEPTGRNGGLLGTVDPATLRPELRDALNGVGTGGLTRIVRIPSGYAIFKVVPSSEAAGRAGASPLQMLSSSASSLVYAGFNIGGLPEADAIFLAMQRRPDWGEDLQGVCEVRRQSIPQVVERLKAAPPELSGAIEPAALPRDQWIDAMETQYAWAQLHAYLGEMSPAIELWSKARRFAEGVPDALPRMDETLGVAYLHTAELDNGVYRAPGDFCLFPPAPGAPKALPEAAAARKAVQYFEQYLERKPDDLEVKWLLNLAHLALGSYPSGVPPAHLIPPGAFASGPAASAAIGRFRDVAPQAGINAASLAGGAIVDDFDNDGHLDVVTSSMDVCEPLHFFHNNGDGRFTEKTKEAGLSDQLGGLNLLQADYNNDGCMDLLVLRGGWEFRLRPSLLKNNCNGTFTDVTREAGLPSSIRTQTAAWADFDNDGNLDLFLPVEDGPSRLYRNTGRGTFEDVTQKARINIDAFIKAVVPGDYDNDGYVDFYLTNYEGNNFLLHNNRDGTFTEVGKDAGVQAPWRSFAAWFFDYDNDGWDDLFVTSYYISTDESVRTYLGRPHNAETLKLYRNLRNGRFKDVSAEVGLDKVWMPMAANFGDVNNDGFLDMYLGMGSPSFTSVMPHELLLNLGGKSFVSATAASGTGELHKGHGIAFADLDRDGDEDIVAEVGGAVPADRHPIRVFENPGNTNGWINIRLSGVKTNRSAIGARVSLMVDGREIHRTVSSGGSFGANPMEMHVGIGAAARIDAIEVWWPVSNTRQRFTGIAKNQFIQITELAPDYARISRTPVRLGGPAPKQAAAAIDRHDMTGVVLSVDAGKQTLSVSCDSVPGFMPAMVMAFTVKEPALLANVRPGAAIEFTVAIDGSVSNIERLRVRRYQSLESKPSEYRRLELLSQLAGGETVKQLEPGQPVPDFTLTDQAHQPITFSKFAGATTVLTFTYVRCPNPAYCFRLAGNLSQVQRRFKARLGKDLVLLTIAIDPALDRGEALAEYARTWTTDPRAWHFLTGPLTEIKRVAGLFGVQFWQDEGSLTHSFHTAVIDRRGILVGNLDGNEFTARQLGDLVQTVLDR